MTEARASGVSLQLHELAVVDNPDMRVLVTRAEFAKLTAVPGTDVRYLRLLWKGITLGSARAGTGAYVFKTKVTLLPVPGVAGPDFSASTVNTMGLLRVQ